MLDVVAVPPCAVVRLESGDAPAGRYFASYVTRGGFVSMAGHPVIDEFATLSSPIFLAPRAWLGTIYDTGISLGHQRDPEAGIDLGWPPLCLGLEVAAPGPDPEWPATLLSALRWPFDPDRPAPAEVEIHRWHSGRWELRVVQVAQATILVTSAPLLPRQLRRLCEAGRSDVVVGVATGNRLGGTAPGRPHEISTISEEELEHLRASIRDQLRAATRSETISPESDP